MLVQLLKSEKTEQSFIYKWKSPYRLNLEPFVIGTIALSSKVIPAWVGYAVTAGIAAISIGTSYLLKPNIPSSGVGAFDNPVVDPETFLPVGYGKFIMPFLPVFMDTHPEDINLLMGIGGQCHGKISGLYKIYFGNMELVTKLVDNTYEISEKFKDKVEFWQRRGADDPKVYEDFTNVFRKWTSRHLGAGVASLAFRIKFDKKNITGIPSIQLVYNGKLLYDPRTKKTVSSITRSGSTATVTTSSIHELSVNDYVQIVDATQSNYNGIFLVATVINTTSFTYTVVGTPTTPATGTIYLGKVYYNSNSVLAVLDYLINTKYGTSANLTTGIDTDSFIAEANYSDELIDYQIVDPPKNAPTIEVIERNTDWLGSGSDYKYKYSYCRGTVIYDEGTSYILYESNLSPESTTMSVSSNYGQIKLTGILNSGESDVTLKRIYRQLGGVGSYYYIGVIDADQTTFIDNIADINIGDAHSATGSPPTAPTGAITATFTNYNASALDTNKYYRYKFALLTSQSPRRETAPSPASKRLRTKKNSTTAIRITGIPDSEDTQVTHVRIYRSEGFDADSGNNLTYKKLIDVTTGTTSYVDLIADTSLDASTNPLSASTTISSKIKRFTCNGLLDTGEDISTNREKLLSSCRGKLYKQAGKWKIFIPKIVIAETFELNENNIIGDWSFSLLGANSMPNTVKASFINPDTQWKSDTVIWPKIDEDNLYLKDDKGLQSNITLDLPFTNNKYIAKTICQVIRKEARNNIRVELTAKEEARKLTVGRCVKLTHSMPGWIQKKFWVEAVGLFPNATVRLILLEYTETDYNYESLTEDILPGYDTTFPDPTEVPDEVTSVVLTEESYYENQSKHWRIKGTFVNPLDSFWDYSEIYIKIGTGDYAYYTSIDKDSNGVFYIDPVEEFSLYSIKILSVSILGAKQDIDSDENTVWTHNTGNTEVPPNVNAIFASVRGDVVELNWLEIIDSETGRIPFDFDCYEIQEKEWVVGGSYIIRTRATRQVLTNVSSGVHTYFIKARDKATSIRNGDGSISPVQGNESAGTASVSVTVLAVSTETLIANNNFSTGTHVGTEQASYSGYNVLRMIQNYLSEANVDFEAGIGNWGLGSGWSRVSTSVVGSTTTVTPKNGSYMIKCPPSSNGSYSALTTGIVATVGRQYLFKGWIWCNKPNTARVALYIDTAGTTYSQYHPGDSQWHVLFATVTVGIAPVTPTVYFTTESTFPTATSFFDYCGYSLFSGTYTSPVSDLTTVAIRRYWLDYDTVSQGGGEIPPGYYLIDLMVSDDASSWTIYTGLESSEIVVSGRHVKYVIRFFNMWTNQILYIKEMLSSQGLQQGNPQGFINNSLYLPLGNIVIGED